MSGVSKSCLLIRCKCDAISNETDLPLQSVLPHLFKGCWGVGLGERDNSRPVILVIVGHVYVDELRPLMDEM